MAKTNSENEQNFGSVLQYWLTFNEKRKKKSTMAKYRFLAEKHILPELGGVKMSELNETTVNNFINEKLKTLSNGYVRTMAIIIKSALILALNTETVKNFDPQKIAVPTAEKSKPQVLNFSEQKALENHIKNNIDAENFGILLSLYTGLRLGEICALKWQNVNLNEGVISVNFSLVRVNENGKWAWETGTPKTPASVREVPIIEKLLPLFETVKNSSNSPFVVAKGDVPLNPRTLEERFEKAQRQAGISHRNFHTLRHTFATNCVACGVDVKTLSEILGHTSVSTTMNLYVHTSFEMKKTQLNKLNNI